MVKFEEIFGNFVMIGLLVLALFSLIIIVQSSNSAEQPLIEDELFNSTYLSLNGTLADLEGTSSGKYGLFSTEKPAPGIISIVVFSIVNVVKTFADVVFVLFTVVIKVPLVVLGVDPTITSMIVSFLTISIIVAMWIVYKFGG